MQFPKDKTKYKPNYALNHRVLFISCEFLLQLIYRLCVFIHISRQHFLIFSTERFLSLLSKRIQCWGCVFNDKTGQSSARPQWLHLHALQKFRFEWCSNVAMQQITVGTVQGARKNDWNQWKTYDETHWRAQSLSWIAWDVATISFYIDIQQKSSSSKTIFNTVWT